MTDVDRYMTEVDRRGNVLHGRDERREVALAVRPDADPRWANRPIYGTANPRMQTDDNDESRPV